MARLQPGRKAIASVPEVSDIRELGRADLAVLTIPRPGPQLQNLRDNHHRIARAVASGLSNADVAALCGCSINRVGMLRSDPAFRDLVAHKRAMLDAEWASAGDPVIDFLRGNALKAAAMLSDRLDIQAQRANAAIEAAEAAGEIVDPAIFGPTRDLLGIAELGFDRTGYGKVNKNVNVNVDFAANLEAMRKRSSRAREPRTIESVPASQSSAGGTDASPARNSQPMPTFRRL